MRITGKDTLSISDSSFQMWTIRNCYLTYNLYPLTTWKEFSQQRRARYSPCPWPRQWTPPYHRPGPLRWPPRSKSPWCHPPPPSWAARLRRWRRVYETPGGGEFGTVSWLHFLSEGNTSTWHDSISSAGEACVSLEDTSLALKPAALKPRSYINILCLHA